MSRCENGNERFTVYLDGEIFQLLKEYVFVADVRTYNTAAREIITDFLLDWKEFHSSK